ncbi:ATP-dependent Clp protease adaptor ClpS [Leptospira sp. 96542]|nr:ATP-dependent Clp protease adaptor ClpS [Leptospira sp. 96542]
MTFSQSPYTKEESETKVDSIYSFFVILHNDSINDFGYVEDCLMKFCFKTKKEAKQIAMEAHNNGKAICFNGSSEECETVAEKLTNSNLTVTLGK